MSSLGAKRKARMIKVDEPDDGNAENKQQTTLDPASSPSVPGPIFPKASRKPFRQSGLRKSINIEDADDKPPPPPEDADEDGPVVVKPALSRAGSTKQKKRKSTSRLSFGARADDDGEEDTTPSTPKRREGSSLKKVIALKDLAMRQRGEEEDQPKYTKEYLEELQSSTPNTPQDVSRTTTEEDEMSFDISELEGAMIVEAEDVSREPKPTRILSEAEIREKKERRARLAKEEDFISLDDEDDPFTSKKKDETRLVREDEDLGEGFDEFVEDGGVALGKNAEREARKRRRQEMASLISQAEGNSEDESDDSDAERRAAYEAAQTRAGMDGLQRPQQKPADQLLNMKPKITPLPTMAECLQGLQSALQHMEQELNARSQKMSDLRKEREEIKQREVQVQRLLNEAGEKYQAAVGSAGAKSVTSVTSSPARPIMPGEVNEFARERGLESFGTPSRQDDTNLSHR